VSELLGAAAIRDVLTRKGVRPTKSLGQNFVIDPNTIRKMLDMAALEPEDVVLEIGAGAGSLTLGLADKAAQVIALEKDPMLVEVLRETLSGLSNVRVVEGDALEIDPSSFGATSLVANLPYNVAATLVISALERSPGIETLTVMTQREVGERLAATPGSKTYGRSSVMVALYGSAAVAAKVSRRAFWPVPNVDSVVVRIDRSVRPLHEDAAAFASVVEACFSSRRKTIRNGLAGLTGNTGDAESILRDAGLDPSARAEVLSPTDFATLTDSYKRTRQTR
jgi:16S rRNA (adenine1518-N6/adenine1519-N6)-dimethyltransferase